MIAKHVLQTIREKIEKLGGVNRIAADLDVHPTTLGRFLKGESQLSQDRLERLLTRVGLALSLVESPNPFTQRRIQIPPKNALEVSRPDFGGARADWVMLPFYDSVEQAIAIRYGRDVTPERTHSAFCLVVGDADKAKISATDGTAGSYTVLQEQDADTKYWVSTGVEVRPRRITAGPLLVDLSLWPPEGQRAQAFVAAVLGSAMRRAYDLLLDEELDNMPSATVASATLSALVDCLTSEAAASVFAPMADGRPRCILLMSPGTLSTLRQNATAGTVEAAELAAGRLLGIEIVACDLPSLATGGDYIAALVPRDRLVYSFAEAEITFNTEMAASVAAMAGLTVSARGDVRVAVCVDEKLGFTIGVTT